MVFFGLRSPLLGLVDIILLWIAILLTIQHFLKVSEICGSAPPPLSHVG